MNNKFLSISRSAYLHWIGRGSPVRDDWSDWFWAERLENDPKQHAWDSFGIDLDRVSMDQGMHYYPGTRIPVALPDAHPNEYGVWGAEWNTDYQWIWGRVEATSYIENGHKIILWKGNYLKSTYGWGTGAEVGYYINEPYDYFDFVSRQWKKRDHWVPRDYHRTTLSLILVNKNNGDMLCSTDRNEYNLRDDKQHWWIQKWSGKELDTWDVILYYKVGSCWNNDWRMWNAAVPPKDEYNRYPWEYIH